MLNRNGEEIPREKYKDAKVEIAYPINESILNLAEAASFAAEGIDIFDASDDFFNDICFAHSTENETDVIVKDRRKDIFQNVSFCADGCAYDGIDYETKKVKCDCEIYLADEEIPPSEDFNDFTNEIFSSNIAVVKCFKSLVKIKASNIGFVCVFLCIMLSATFVFAFKDFVKLKQIIHSKILNSPPKIASNDNSRYIEEEIHTNTNFVNNRKTIEPEYNGPNVIGVPKEIDHFEYKKALRYDTRSLFGMFWDIYLDKEEISKICHPSLFECYSLNLNFFVFKICFDFLMNGIFYSDEQLSFRYQNGSLTFAQDLLRSIPSNIISAIVCAIFKSFVSYPPMLEMLFVEVKTKKIVVFIEKIYCSLIRKFVFFHVLLFILILLSLYYLTLFSIIYKSSQMSWFTGCLYSVLTSIIINIGIALGLSVLRLIAITYQSKYLYNVELYIHRMV